MPGSVLSLGALAVKVWFLSKQSLKHGLGTSIYLGNDPGNTLWVWEQEARKGRTIRSVLVIRLSQLGYKALGSLWEAHPVCMPSCSVMSSSLRAHGLKPTRLLCPWNFPGKNTGVASHSLLQGIFPTQVSCIAGRFFTVWMAREAPVLYINTSFIPRVSWLSPICLKVQQS